MADRRKGFGASCSPWKEPGPDGAYWFTMVAALLPPAVRDRLERAVPEPGLSAAEAMRGQDRIARVGAAAGPVPGLRGGELTD